jgi:putative PIN family toxin of toxin-antitoxin system
VVEKATAEAEVLVTESMLVELADVLSRPKLDRYASLEERRESMRKFLGFAKIVPVVTTITACRDPRDNHILEAAVNGSADTIITGDKDLLNLHPFHGIHIVTPADYLAK